MADTEGRSQGLLVADGDVIARHAIADYLRECGYRVYEAANYAEAIVVLETGLLGGGAVLASTELGGEGNGFALRAWVRQHRPEVGVILAGSLEAEAKAAAQLCEDGPDMRRPYEPQLVADRVRRLLASSNR